ncbi:hypothetical protein CVT91_07245 [Candidatus Atribacteria bacterium HGW-Atribacteria-1]|nr:MAG: hypothetical protein CVT91_07245 [Candidatus Atribacteria bacterium HGW-Atribacteria-1]
MKKRRIKDEKIKNVLLNQKGMALLATLIFVFILVTFAVALLTMTSNDSKLSTLQRDSTRAFYLADAGIDKALWYLNTPKDQGGKDMYLWRPPTSPVGQFTEGTPLEYYEISIYDIGGSTDRIEITSVGTVKEGKYSAGKRTVIVTAEIGISPTSNVSYDHAIFTDSNMTLNGGISISGSIHSNGDITNNGTINLQNGSATAVGSTNLGTSLGEDGREDFPKIDFKHFKELVIDPDNPDNPYDGSGNGKFYGKDTSVVFNTDSDLYGIHFIDGDVKIQASLILYDATIFATGTIDVIGSGDVYLKNNTSPLALIAKGDITIGGSVHGEGIIQSNTTVTVNGNVNIEIGAIYAYDGVLNGGGGKINVVYGSGLAGTPVTGTGVEVYLKTSWREAY